MAIKKTKLFLDTNVSWSKEDNCLIPKKKIEEKKKLVDEIKKGKLELKNKNDSPKTN